MLWDLSYSVYDPYIYEAIYWIWDLIHNRCMRRHLEWQSATLYLELENHSQLNWGQVNIIACYKYTPFILLQVSWGAFLMESSVPWRTSMNWPTLSIFPRWHHRIIDGFKNLCPLHGIKSPFQGCIFHMFGKNIHSWEFQTAIKTLCISRSVYFDEKHVPLGIQQ